MAKKQRNWVAHDMLTSKRFVERTIRDRKKDVKPDIAEYLDDECESTDEREEP